MGNVGCKSVKDSPKLIPQNPWHPHPFSSIVIKTSTWTKDSHSLFDFENHSLIRKNIKTAGNSKIFRVGNDVQIRSDGSVPSKPFPEASVTHLAALTYHKGTYTLQEGGETLEQDDKLYYVIKYLKCGQPNQYKSGYKLSEKTVMKLGRVKYLVREIVREDPGSLSRPTHIAPPESATGDSPISRQDTHVEAKEKLEDDKVDEEVRKKESSLSLPALANTESEKDLCRICKGEENSKENPLISACKCSGSIKYVHANCMKAWYQSKLLSRTSPNASSYLIKGLECELCKFKLSLTISYKGLQVDLVDIPRPSQGPYIVLESTSDSYAKEVHVISFNSCNQLKIGRGHECDVRIADSSVSRSHAYLKYVDHEFYLEDNNSKFGTLVQIDGPVRLTSHLPYCVQVGRTVLTLLVKSPMKPSSTFLLEPQAKAVKNKRKIEGLTVDMKAKTNKIEDEGAVDNTLNNAHPSEPQLYY